MPSPRPQPAAELRASPPPSWRQAASPARQLHAPPLPASEQLLEQLPRQLLAQLPPFRLPLSWQLPLLQPASQLQLSRQLPWRLPAGQLPAVLLAAGQLLQPCASGSLLAKPSTRHPHSLNFSLHELVTSATIASGIIQLLLFPLYMQHGGGLGHQMHNCLIALLFNGGVPQQATHEYQQATQGYPSRLLRDTPAGYSGVPAMYQTRQIMTALHSTHS